MVTKYQTRRWIRTFTGENKNMRGYKTEQVWCELKFNETQQTVYEQQTQRKKTQKHKAKILEIAIPELFKRWWFLILFPSFLSLKNSQTVFSLKKVPLVLSASPHLLSLSLQLIIPPLLLLSARIHSKNILPRQSQSHSPEISSLTSWKPKPQSSLPKKLFLHLSHGSTPSTPAL